jgi:antitoxin (DNA-binding transcriptional repressor) of toxin-antitoxin stability system
MVYQITLDEAKLRLLDLIEAALKGDEVFILKDGQQAVQLIRVEPPMRHPQFGSAEGLVTIADDFDAALEDFDEYMP